MSPSRGLFLPIRKNVVLYLFEDPIDRQGSSNPGGGSFTDTRFASVLHRSAGFADRRATALQATWHPDRSGAWGSAGEGETMLHYAVVFFIIALIAAVFGFGGIAAGAVGIAKVLFFVFLILAAVSFIANMARRT